MTTFSPLSLCSCRRASTLPQSFARQLAISPAKVVVPRQTAILSRCLTTRPEKCRSVQPCRQLQRSTAIALGAPHWQFGLTRRNIGGRGGGGSSWIWKDDVDPYQLIVDYNKLPPDYKDEVGLPVAATDLNEEKITEIFSSHMRVRDGNKLLNILHGRRVAGTLNHPEYFRNTAKWSAQDISNGLAWLRKTLPVNETLNAGLRAEYELGQIEAEKIANAQAAATNVQSRGSLSQDVPSGRVGTRTRRKANASRQLALQKESDTPDVAASKYQPDPVFGPSVFDEVRFKREQQAKREEQERREKRKAELLAQGVDPNQVMSLVTQEAERAVVTEMPPMSERMKKYQLAGMLSTASEPPQMSKWLRILPSATVAFCTIGIVLIASHFYVPPRQNARLFPNVPVAIATVATFVAANFAVWFAWKIPMCWRFLNRHFIQVVGLPFPTAVVLSAFSHRAFKHLFTNMLSTSAVAIPLCNELGRMSFVILTVLSAALPNLTSLVIRVLRNQLRSSTLGASGITFSCWTAYFWLHRDDKYRFGIPERVWTLPGEANPGVPGWAFLGATLFTAVLWQRMLSDTIVHASGCAVGLGFAVSAEKLIVWFREKEAARRKVLLGDENRTLRSAEDAIHNPQSKAIPIKSSEEALRYVEKLKKEMIGEAQGKDVDAKMK